MASNALVDLNRVRYAGLDFDTHFDDLRARIQVKFAAEYNDFALSSLGILLIDHSSYGLDTLSFYLDRRATDAYLETARTRSAVARLTRQLGYKMGPSTSSSVDVRAAIRVPVAFSVPIPKGFQFKGPNELVFETAETVTFAPGAGPADTIDIPCYEGETITETFTSNGTVNQTFKLRRVPEDKFIALGTVKVTVDGGTWVENEFLTFETTDQFEVGYNDDPATIRFGDGVAGNIPPNTASIKVQYVACRGLSGQVGSGTIDDVVTPLVVNFTTISLALTNTEGSVGGDDPETIDHAKTFAGKVFKSRKVAVTREDYEALAGSYADPLFGRVAVAQAISSRSAASDLELQTRITNIRGAAQDPVPVVTASAASAETALADVVDQCADLLTYFNAIAAAMTAQLLVVDTAITNARAIKNKAQEIIADAVDIAGFVVDGKAAVDAITTNPTSQLSTTDKAAIKAYFDLINTEASSSTSPAASAIQASADSEIANLGTIKVALSLVGDDLVTSGTTLLDAETARAAILADVGATSTAGARGDVTDIVAAVTLTEASIDADLTAIEEHVDRLLAADCKANLVTVPILARDAAGFYAAPSSSLIQSLQTYLDARKEVTQTVQVTSGVQFLVQAVLTLRVGVSSGFSEQVTKKAVETVVDAVLRDRSFGDHLRTSEVVDAVTAVRGVAFVNVTVDGYYSPPTGVTLLTSKLDSDGNLVIETSEVITKGAVTVNTELLS